MAAALTLAVWWRPECPRVGLASQQKGYPCIHFMQHEKDRTLVHYCPWLTPHHVAHLVTISILLISYSAFHGQVDGYITWGVVGLDKTGGENESGCGCLCVYCSLCRIVGMKWNSIFFSVDNTYVACDWDSSWKEECYDLDEAEVWCAIAQLRVLTSLCCCSTRCITKACHRFLLKRGRRISTCWIVLGYLQLKNSWERKTPGMCWYTVHGLGIGTYVLTHTHLHTKTHKIRDALPPLDEIVLSPINSNQLVIIHSVFLRKGRILKYYITNALCILIIVLCLKKLE